MRFLTEEIPGLRSSFVEKKSSIRVIGIGNLMAGDDAVGTHIIRKLMEHRISGIELIDAGPVGLSLLDLLEGAEKVLIIDAIRSERIEGEMVRLVLPKDIEQISALAWESALPSTHLIGLGEALTMGHALGLLPPHLVIYGIELGQIEMGSGLSVKISRAIENVVSQIEYELKQWSCMNFR